MNKKSDRLLAAFSEIDEKLIEQSAPTNVTKTKNPNLLKWISVAACFVLIAGIGVAAWRSGILNLADAVSEPDDTPEVSDSVTDPPESTAPADTTNNADTPLDQPDINTNAIGGGTYKECPLHGSLGQYGTIPGKLDVYVGQAYSNSWSYMKLAKANADPDQPFQRENGCTCEWTFADYMEDFFVPDRFIIDYYYNDGGYYTEEWDLDMILSRDWEAFDEYCRTPRGYSVSEEMDKRQGERIFKSDLLDYLKNSTDEKLQAVWRELTSNGKNRNYGRWSIARYVDMTGMELETLNSIFSDSSISKATGEKRAMYEYDFSLLYNEESMAYFLENPEGLYPIQIDMLLRINWDETPEASDRKHLGIEYISCPVHEENSPYVSYMFIPRYLVDYVGIDKVNDWVNENCESGAVNTESDGCTCTTAFPMFIEHFDIPNEMIVDYYYNQGGYYIHGWDMDIILSHDWEAFDRYIASFNTRIEYSNNEYTTEIERRTNEEHFKQRLLARIKNSSDENLRDYWNTLTDNGTDYNVAKWSIAEFVDKTGFDIDTLNSIIEEFCYYPRLDVKRPMFEYDFSLLYDEESMAYFLDNPDGLYPVQIDMLLHK